MRSRVLFVTNRNILTTCGELRLIKNRAESLYAQYGVATDFVALAKSERIHAAQRERIDAGGSTTELLLEPKLPWTFFRAHRALRRIIQSSMGRYDALIFSGPGMPLYAKQARRLDGKILLYADVHEASEDIVEQAKHANAAKKMMKSLIDRLNRKGLTDSVPYLNGYFVVTPALRDYVQERYGAKAGAQYIIAPCATGAVDSTYREAYYEYRREYRKRFQIRESEKVFIYSGGVSVWQCIGETLELYRRIRKSMPNARMLIFSHKKEAVLDLLKGDDDIQAYSFCPEELKKALCAGDYAFLLRQDCITNHVAFPNKYLEYVLSGMKIITTPYLYEIAEQVRKERLGFLYSMDGQIDGLLKYLHDDPADAADWNDRMRVLKYNGFEESLKPFYDAMKGEAR